jgi:hypothetical protein
MSVIPNQSDRAANTANVSAIDKVVGQTPYRHVVAWGKFLGFAPTTVLETVLAAEDDQAPINAIQKIKGEWLTVDSVQNEQNRAKVEALAGKGI